MGTDGLAHPAPRTVHGRHRIHSFHLSSLNSGKQLQKPITMQASSLCFTASLTPRGAKALAPPRRTLSSPGRRAARLPAVAAVPENLTVDYSSPASVFPAEACETIGGDACDVEMFPEVKPVAQGTAARGASAAAEEVDREYLDYNEPKTVFPGEACDDLGGEFCEPEYQSGVHKEILTT